MVKKTTLLLVVLCTSLSINAQDWWGKSKKVKGNGNLVTVNRTTQDFDGISVGGSFDVILEKGEEGKISIEGEENIIPYIETTVERNTLEIKFQKNTRIRTTKRLTITVYFSDIDYVSLGGSGNIESKDVIKNKNLKINLSGSGNISLSMEADEASSRISGSGNINLTGKLNNFSCTVTGSGNIRAYELESDFLDAKITGSGSIKTTVNSKIKAKVVGSGNIYYKGNPKNTDLKSLGSGDIIDKN